MEVINQVYTGRRHLHSLELDIRFVMQLQLKVLLNDVELVIL